MQNWQLALSKQCQTKYKSYKWILELQDKMNRKVASFTVQFAATSIQQVATYLTFLWWLSCRRKNVGEEASSSALHTPVLLLAETLQAPLVATGKNPRRLWSVQTRKTLLRPGSQDPGGSSPRRPCRGPCSARRKQRGVYHRHCQSWNEAAAASKSRATPSL
jgi:hypothetical protein